MPPASGRLCKNFGSRGGLAGFKRNGMGLLKGTERRTVVEVDLREFERPHRIVPAANVEFRAMIGECQQVPIQECLESRPCGLKLRRRLVRPSRSLQHVRQPPRSFRIAAGERGPEGRLRVAKPVRGRIDFRKVHARRT